ncbi:MAG: hypothetical protein H0T46_04080, partial [Deltaproteobacteria bacterium]|nr:hypothetical protein [Deltaproteobacteria bacterium]
LKAEWLFYGDGSRQVAPEAYYDTALHARCTPVDWADGTVRCVPEADTAYYTEATCETAVGYAEVIGKPRHFLAYDVTSGVRLPSVIYHASTTSIDPPALVYELVDGECTGPRSAPADFPWFEISGVGDTVELTERELEEGERIALRVRESVDGLHVPVGLRDRDLDVPCVPDGDACVPVVTAIADVFLDSRCETPGVAVRVDDPLPALVQLRPALGCATVHRLGASHTGSLFRRSGAACMPAFPTRRGFELGVAVEPAPLTREVVRDRAHRLHRVALTSGALRFHDVRMFDTATRGECTPVEYETVTRCIPATTLPATRLFTQGCAVEVPIAEVPDRSCGSAAFAALSIPDVIGPGLHAIGARTTAPLFDLRSGTCAPYVAPAGTSPHALGPELPTGTFVGGHPAGER